jgi:TonB family protein
MAIEASGEVTILHAVRCIGEARFGPLRLLRLILVVFVISAVPILLTAQAASAQQQEIDALASKLGEALSNRHAKAVAVFVFKGPGDGVTQLGISWSEQLSAAIARPENKFKVLSRAQLDSEIQKENLAADQAWDKEAFGLACSIASHAGATALVIGAISEDSDTFRLIVDSYQVFQGKRINVFGVSIRKTPEIESLLASKAQDLFESAPMAGAKGYGVPRCTHCPSPPLAQMLSEKRIQPRDVNSATVVLRILVTTQGRAEDIQVVKNPDERFTQLAIDTVSKWQFEPAKDPSGSPAPTETLVMVKFNIIK